MTGGEQGASGGPRGFRYRRRVQFAETDLAGIVHFSVYFRYMEEAEHALWREAGLDIGAAGTAPVWPRVAAAFDYKAPLTFDDEVDVLVRIARVSRRTIGYAFRLLKGDVMVGHGTLTAVCVSVSAGGAMASRDLPEGVVARLLALTGDAPAAEPGRPDVS